MRWLYAVMPSAEPVDELTGLSGAPLCHTDARGLRIVSEECSATPTATRDALLSFGASVQHLCRSFCALPFRFGTTVASEAELVAALDARGAEWERRLEATRGLCEYIVHAASTDTVSADRSSGTAYLQALAERTRHSRALNESLISTVSELCRETRLLQAVDGTIRVACLLPPESSAALDLALRHSHPEARIQLTGPWPPFSFAVEPR